MEFILVGGLFFLYYSFTEFHRKYTSFWKDFIDEKQSASYSVRLLDLILCGIPLNLINLDPVDTLKNASNMSENNLWSNRQILFNLATSPLNHFLWVLLILTLGQVNGLYGFALMAPFALLYPLLPTNTNGRKFSQMMEIALSLLTLLISYELLQMKLSFFQNDTSATSLLWMYLSDGRPLWQILWLTLGILFALPQVRVLGWHLGSAPFLLALGTLLVSHHLAHPLTVLHLFWGARFGELLNYSWNQLLSRKPIVWLAEFLIVNTIGLLFNFILAGFLKDWFLFTTPRQELFILIFGYLSVQLILLMIWGHFRSQQK